MAFNFYFDVASILVFVILIVMVISTKHIVDSTFRTLYKLTTVAFLVPILDIAKGDAIKYEVGFTPAMILIMLFFVVHIFVTYYFLMYVMSKIEMFQNRSTLRKIVLYAPVVICLVLILLTPQFHVVFTYSIEQGFIREPLYPIVNVVPIFYFIWTIIYTILKRKYLKRSFKTMIIFVMTINFVAIVIETLFTDIAIRSFIISMSAVVMFFYEEQGRAEIEEDTNLVDKEYLVEEGVKMLRNNYPFSVILIKMSNYDALSDTFGHNNTQTLSKKIASYIGHRFRLGKCFRISESTIAVLNTDEDARELTEKLYEELNVSWDVEGLDISCDILMTYVKIPEDVDDLENMVSFVRYFNKVERSVGGIIEVSELHINEHIREKHVESAIERGLQNGSFEVYYQPIRDLEKDTFVTAEALVRLTDPELGPISPAEFIPIAENNGTIVAIGNFVLETVCKFISENDMEALGLHYIELNLSVIQCLQKDFIENVESIVGKYNIDPKYLCLEVTETASNYSPAVFTKNLEALGERGYALALDDFGTGYANIERMVTSDFRIVKFDKEMTQYSSGEERLQDVFEKLQNVIHSMDSMVVAEGVETKEQYDYLKSIGCDYIQGYYFSKPVPQKEFVEFVKANNS
ncbi:MAG: GGDEF domain-containing phosphodiesterase [Lachnospiraceae bacterium]|nr:GGDEF domain-containing phosphodiesterase [Lachnospiraceae bacterium]